jgi:hypothetical protein
MPTRATKSKESGKASGNRSLPYLRLKVCVQPSAFAERHVLVVLPLPKFTRVDETRWTAIA